MSKTPSALQLGNRNVVNKNNKNNNQKTFTTMKNNVQTSPNFYEVATINNDFMVIVRSNGFDTRGIKEHFSKRLRNSGYLTFKKLEVKSCENALIVPHALGIIHDTWTIKEEKRRVHKVSRFEQVVLSEDTLKRLNVKGNHIEVTSCYNESGGASQEFRVFKTIIDICDNLGITLDYAGTRNTVWLRDGQNKITVTKHPYGLDFTFDRWEEEIYTEIIDF